MIARFENVCRERVVARRYIEPQMKAKKDCIALSTTGKRKYSWAAGGRMKESETAA